MKDFKSISGCSHDIEQIIRELEDGEKFDRVTIRHSEVCLSDFPSIQLGCKYLELDHCDLITEDRETTITTNVEITNCKFKGLINKIVFTSDDNKLKFIMDNTNLNYKKFVLEEATFDTAFIYDNINADISFYKCNIRFLNI